MKKSINAAKTWKKIIGLFEKGNLNKVQFCKKNGINLNHFYYWCNKLRPDLKSPIHADKSKNSFIPITTNTKNESFTITLGDGPTINFSSMPEPSWIASLVLALGCLNDKY